MSRLMYALPLLFVAACSDDAPEAPAGTEVAANGAVTAPAPMAATPAAVPSASGPGTAFGLTTRQLEDADLIDTTGRDLGDVERVETDASGEVVAVIVEVDDTSPDRFVRMPITRLTAVADGDDWDLRAATSREELMALPQVDRR